MIRTEDRDQWPGITIKEKLRKLNDEMSTLEERKRQIMNDTLHLTDQYKHDEMSTLEERKRQIMNDTLHLTDQYKHAARLEESGNEQIGILQGAHRVHLEGKRPRK